MDVRLIINLVFCISSCAAIWNTAKYEVIQNNAAVTSSKKFLSGDDYLDPYFCGVKIHQITQVTTGLDHMWCRNAVFESGYTYMIKRFQRDSYDPPLHLYFNTYSDEVTYFTYFPGLFEVGSQVIVRVTPYDHWFRFAVTFMNHTDQIRPFKMKVWGHSEISTFCWEDDEGDERGTETVSEQFPFISNTMSTITFIITSHDMEVKVNDVFYYAYSHKLDYIMVDSVAIWFEGIVSSLFVHSIDLVVPSIAPPAP